MTRLVLIRHAATAWNAAHRVQGRADVPLSAEGRAEAARWRLPADLARADARWVTSPLGRARETAALMGARHAAVEPRLIEMDWGDWEGARLADLRARHGASMTANEARGLDFRPEGGESPREVQARLVPWLVEMATRGGVVVAVTHKGVIRALLARATGWDMIGRAPSRIERGRAHLLDLADGGGLAVAQLDLALAPS